MSSVGEVKTKKLEYTFRSDNKKRLLECKNLSFHGICAWSHRSRYILSYQIMVACGYCDSSIRNLFVDAVDLFYLHKKVIINECIIKQVIAEYIASFFALDNVIKGFARPRDGY